MEGKEAIADLAKEYLKKEEEWGGIAQRLRFNSGKIQIAEALEADLIYPVEARKPRGVFAAVDGGMGVEEFHGLDLFVLRALAAKFEYNEGKLIGHGYYPSSRPALEVSARTGLESFEKLRYGSLIRLRSELRCAIGAIDIFKPDYLMLDGSLAPLLSDKPPDDSELKDLYGEVVALYQKLYSTAAANGINLIGVTKDSRGRRYLDIISKAAPEAKDALNGASDTLFLDHLLKEGERTFVFRYSAAPSQNSVLKDLGEWAGRILTFYIKPVAGDRPIRIEFLSTASPFAEVAQVMAGICKLHPHYAYPAVLIEVDLRAALEPGEVEHVVHDLSTRVGKKRPLMQLRRNSRPFR